MWQLSYLPGRVFTEDQARAGMELADTVTRSPEGDWQPAWMRARAQLLGDSVEALVAAVRSS